MIKIINADLSHSKRRQLKIHVEKKTTLRAISKKGNVKMIEQKKIDQRKKALEETIRDQLYQKPSKNQGQ